MNTLFDGTHLSFIIVYLAGFMTFFASCLLPLVPTYLAYLAGLGSLNTQAESHRMRMVVGSVYFVLGFLLVFVTLGLSINVLNNRVVLVRLVLEKLGGLLFIGLGLMMMEWIRADWFMQSRSLWSNQWLSAKTKTIPWWAQATVAGMGFAASWTPCIGPVLAAVLYWSTRTHPVYGVALLTTYGLGLGTPFILVSLAYQAIWPQLKKYQHIGWYSTKLAGIFLLFVGVLMVLGQFQYLSVWLLTELRLNTLAM